MISLVLCGKQKNLIMNCALSFTKHMFKSRLDQVASDALVDPLFFFKKKRKLADPYLDRTPGLHRRRAESGCDRCGLRE